MRRCAICDHEERQHVPECRACWADPDIDASDACDGFE